MSNYINDKLVEEGRFMEAVCNMHYIRLVHNYFCCKK